MLWEGEIELYSCPWPLAARSETRPVSRTVLEFVGGFCHSRQRPRLARNCLRDEGGVLSSVLSKAKRQRIVPFVFLDVARVGASHVDWMPPFFVWFEIKESPQKRVCYSCYGTTQIVFGDWVRDLLHLLVNHVAQVAHLAPVVERNVLFWCDLDI